MPSFTPLRKTYSTLSSSSSSSDDIRSRNPKEIVVQANQSSPRTIPRHSFLIRVIIFILLEFAFIALVSAALHRPIFLDLSFTITEVKGAVTAIAIFWHAAAVYVVKDILLNIFSGEWIGQYDGSQNLTLQELDIVSRLTTGVIDQAKHCISKRATYPFRLSFLSFLLLILLNGLGPSAIGVDHTPYNYPSTIQVANVTPGAGRIDEFPSIAVERASTFVHLEVLEKSATVGFSIRQPNILIPWPSSDSLSENTTVRYHSDVIRYNFSCSWKKASLNTSFNCIAGLDGQCLLSFLDKPLVDSDILPLGPIQTLDTNSLATFLFVGRNGTLPSALNLADIPSGILPCNTSQNPTYLDDSPEYQCEPLLMSALACDPQFEVLPAIINATGSVLEASISSGAPTVKNIPTSAATALFSISLYGATSDTTVSHQLFLPTLPFDMNNPWKPLSLDEINQNMTNALASAAKAYLSGLRPNDDNSMLYSFTMVNTSARVEVQKMAVVGSKPFFVASSVTVGLLVVFLGALVAITRPDQLEGFDLENIVRKLQ